MPQEAVQCPRCGSRSPFGSNYCRACGEVLNQINSEQSGPQGTKKVAAVTCPFCGKALLHGASSCWCCGRILFSGHKPTMEQAGEKADSIWKLSPVLIIALLLAGGGVSGYWYWTRLHDSQATNQSSLATKPLSQIQTASASAVDPAPETPKAPDSVIPSEVADSKTAAAIKAGQSTTDVSVPPDKEAEARPVTTAAAVDGLSRENPVAKPAEDALKTQNLITPPAQAASPGITENRYSGPKAGVLVWSGQMNKDENIVIEGTGAAKGSLHGDFLPGVPVQIEIQPQSIVIAEHPSVFNGYKRIVIRSKVRRNTVVLIRWSISKK